MSIVQSPLPGLDRQWTLLLHSRNIGGDGEVKNRGNA